MENPLKETFGSNLKRLRLNSQFNQKELATMFNIDTRTWRRWESTQNTWPPAGELPKLANTLNCSIDDLYEHDPTFLPQTRDERELLMVSRMANPNLPRRQIINAITYALGKLTPANRKLWLDLATVLSKIK